MSTASAVASIGARLTSETFVCEHLGRHLVHVPLLATSLLVSPRMAALVGRLRQGPVVPRDAAEARGLARLRELGLIDGPSPPPPRSVLQESPTEVSLFLTERCNLRCVYCYARGGEGGRSMSPVVAESALRRVLENARRLGAGRIGIHFHGGGEVSLVWDLLTRIARLARDSAAAAGLGVRLSAGLNGVMSAERAAEVPRWLDEATLSCDGLPAVHDRQRPTAGGGPSAHLVERTMRVLDAAGFSYGLRVTLLPETVGRMSAGVEHLCRHSRARVIQVEPAFPLGRYGEGEPPDPWGFVAAFRAARQVARSYGRELRYSGARFPQVTDVFCQAVTGAFAVTVGGLVTSCFEATETDARFVYGHYDPATSGFSIDPHRHRAQLRRSVAHRADCRDCIARYHCAGDCAMKAAAGGLPVRCVINRELTKDAILEDLGEALV